MCHTKYVDVPLLTLSVAILMFHLSVPSVVAKPNKIKICTIWEVTAEMYDRDVSKVKTYEKQIQSTESFKKSVQDWSIVFGRSISAMEVEASFTNEFKRMTSDELTKKNYSSVAKTQEREFGKDSRQIIRKVVTKVTVQYHIGDEMSQAVATSTDEIHVESVNKKDCIRPEDDRLYKKASRYINQTYSGGNGTITGNKYKLIKCGEAGKRSNQRNSNC